MIIIYELEKFIQEIEEKSKGLEGVQRDNAQSKIYTLIRAVNEIKEITSDANDWFGKFGDSELEVSKGILTELKLRKHIIELENELKNVKQCIN